ncbi:MAG: CYTH domain-containing protein [Victivallales bacterium]|nr:CYTH domain-containing protein [Victivallales bacterium]
MGMEIERKFLVRNDSWRQGAAGVEYCQGYCPNDRGTIRVRRAGDCGYLTIKGKTSGFSRREYEYAIPSADAEALLELICVPPYIRKTRYRVEYRGKTWEIDVFAGENTGLILAELELTREDEPFELPPWTGAEVTGDPRYYNSQLAVHPFSRWDAE